MNLLGLEFSRVDYSLEFDKSSLNIGLKINKLFEMY